MSFIKYIKTTAAALVVATGLTSGAASAATYNPFGVQNDVAVADVVSGGWSVIYSGRMSQNASLTSVFAGAGDMVMLAARRVGSSTFDVLAAIDSAIFIPLQTSLNTTIDANGARWYKNGYSMGFAGATDAISQNTADVQAQTERDRLSWHTNWTGYAPDQNASDPAAWLSPGWRSGNNISLNSAANWERVVLTANMTPVPVPGALPLLLGGLGGLVALRRRKKAA